MRPLDDSQAWSGDWSGKILSMYARGMTSREIRAHLKAYYHVDAPLDWISRNVTDVSQEAREWRSRPLDPCYPVVIFCSHGIKVRDRKSIRSKTAHLAIGITPAGGREVLGLWIQQHAGDGFWSNVGAELKSRGVEDVLIAVVEGREGPQEAFASAFPRARVQMCIAPLLRKSLEFVSYKDRNAVAADLDAILCADTERLAERRLSDFEIKWNAKYPPIALTWRHHWDHVRAFLAYPPAIRRVVNTSGNTGTLNTNLRKLIHSRNPFSSDEAAEELLYLALRNAEKRLRRPIRRWHMVLVQLATLCGGRLPASVH